MGERAILVHRCVKLWRWNPTYPREFRLRLFREEGRWNLRVHVPGYALHVGTGVATLPFLGKTSHFKY